MTTAAVSSQFGGLEPPGFAQQLLAEWTKIRSIRSFYVELALTLILALGFTALISLAIGGSFDQLSAQDQATFDPVLTSFVGRIFGLVTLIVLGVTFSAFEYTSGMIRLTMTATPQRGRVLAAKAAIVFVVSLLVGVIIAFGCFLVGQTVFKAYDVPTGTLSDGATLRAVVAAWLTTPVWPLLGLAIGFILRSTASAITTTLVLIFGPAFFGGLLPDWWQKHLLAYLPTSAEDSLLSTRSTASSLTHLDAPVAALVLVAWLAVALGVAYALLRRRDV